MKKFYVEKYNASDDSFELTDVYFKSGQAVESDDLVFSISSSKADIDVECNNSGFIYHNKNIGDEICVGDLFYFISENKLDDEDLLFKSDVIKNINSVEGLTISAKAKKIIIKNNVNPLEINKTFIKESDVLAYLANKNPLTQGLSKNLLPSDFENNIIIIGGKGGCKMIIEAILSTNKYTIKGIVDNELSIGTKVMDIEIIGNDNHLQEIFDLGYKNIVISFTLLGNLKNRNKRFDFYSHIKFLFPNIIHKKAYLEPSVKMGFGNIFLAGANIGSEVKFGNMNFINTSSTICHECIINNNNHFAPNSTVAGRVSFGDNNLIGMTVTVFHDINIGSNNILNNGYNLNSSIDDNLILKSDN